MGATPFSGRHICWSTATTWNGCCCPGPGNRPPKWSGRSYWRRGLSGTEPGKHPVCQWIQWFPVVFMWSNEANPNAINNCHLELFFNSFLLFWWQKWHWVGQRPAAPAFWKRHVAGSWEGQMLSLRLVLKYCAMHVLDVTWITRVFEHGGGP